MNSNAEPGNGLKRRLGLFDATMLIVGDIIGIGAFAVTGLIAAALPNPAMIMVVWVVGGLLTLFGALTYAELGAALPRAGEFTGPVGAAVIRMPDGAGPERVPQPKAGLVPTCDPVAASRRRPVPGGRADRAARGVGPGLSSPLGRRARDAASAGAAGRDGGAASGLHRPQPAGHQPRRGPLLGLVPAA